MPSPSPVGPSGMALDARLLLGSATSAYQIEGATTADGRGPSIWDTFCRRPGVIADGSSGEPACDHYHRWAADVELMAELGMQTYRFSIAWPRIYPNGTGRVNQVGLDFYRRLTDRLLTKGITPLATLYHWDLPQALQDRGGWQNRDSASWFADYAATVFDALDVVPRWVTINEPKSIVRNGYQFGTMAPGMEDPFIAGRVLHHLLLAHGRAVQAFRASKAAGDIGPCCVITPCYPVDDSAEAAKQAKIADVTFNTVYLDPMLRGRYPDSLDKLSPRELVRGIRDAQRDGDVKAIGQPVDFAGINYYAPNVIDRNGQNAIYFPTTALSWQQVYPNALYDYAVRLHRDYGLPLIITESGTPDYPHAAATKDPYRVRFVKDHLRVVQQAINAGVDIRGFHVWSLLDNFEWVRGYTQRWGLVRVDFSDQRRTPKQSARWYADVIKTRRV